MRWRGYFIFRQAADWKPATDNQSMFNAGVYYLLRGFVKVVPHMDLRRIP
jgi:hypothetical protein